MNQKKLLAFLVEARANTYATGGNKVTPVFPGGKQYEFKDGDWLYSDFYNQGNKKFMGLETVYFKNKPVWSNCYYGNFEKMSEDEVDKILRTALVEKKDKARLWFNVEYKSGNYLYECHADSGSNLNECSGSEEISKGPQKVYSFYYAGGLIGGTR